MKRISMILLSSLLMLFPLITYAEENSSFRHVTAMEPIVQYLVSGKADVNSFQYEVKADGEKIGQGVGQVSDHSFRQVISIPKGKVQGNPDLQLVLTSDSGQPPLVIPLNEENQEYGNDIFHQVQVEASHVLYQIKGEARIFEATYHYEVSDGHHVLAEGYGTASEGAPNWGAFTLDIQLAKEDLPINGAVVLELYVESMKDGSRQDSYFLRIDQLPW